MLLLLMNDLPVFNSKINKEDNCTIPGTLWLIELNFNFVIDSSIVLKVVSNIRNKI